MNEPVNAPTSGDQPTKRGMPMKNHYGRFVAMIVTSTVVMYGLMYLNTYQIDHVYFSQTRMWMALYMGAVMAVIMLAFMRGMYSDRRVNTGIVAASAVLFGESVLPPARLNVGADAIQRMEMRPIGPTRAISST